MAAELCDDVGAGRHDPAAGPAGIGDGGFDQPQREAQVTVLRRHAGMVGDDGVGVAAL